MKIIAKGLVYSGEPGTDRQSCAFPGICVLPNGRWLCSIRTAPAKKDVWPEKILITWSDDQGGTWSDPVSTWKDQIVDGKTGMFHAGYLTPLGGTRVLIALMWVDHSNPDLPFFNEETEGLLDTRIMFSESSDSGETWSKPELVDTAPVTMATPLTGPVLILENGEWACQFELNKHFYDLEPWRHNSVLMFSSDQGKTWGEATCTSNDPQRKIFYWDQRSAVMPDGRILDLFWTYDNIAGKYLNIHARESTDNGRSWSEMWETGVRDQPAQPVPLLDGTIAMVYVDRTNAPVIKMRTSNDGAKTWPEETELIISVSAEKKEIQKKSSMQDAWEEMGKYSLGLPATALTPDNKILTVYYAGEETDVTGIEWALISGD